MAGFFVVHAVAHGVSCKLQNRISCIHKVISVLACGKGFCEWAVGSASLKSMATAG